jgi:methylase of polypeptide subunit release factors
MRLLASELNYVWTVAVVYPSSPATLYRYRIKSLWKPVLVFSKTQYAPAEKSEWFIDRLEGEGRTKENHDWEQGLGEAHSLIEYFTFPGDLVVDPFLGSGTNGLAAVRLRRKFIGCDIDEKAVGITTARINDVGNPKTNCCPATLPMRNEEKR